MVLVLVEDNNAVQMSLTQSIKRSDPQVFQGIKWKDFSVVQYFLWITACVFVEKEVCGTLRGAVNH